MHNPGRIQLRSSARTNPGRVRENNEDNVHLWVQDALALAIVADGMGGAAAGEEASRIAIETIQEGFQNPEYPQYQDVLDEDLSESLRQAIRRANLNIMERAAVRPEYKGMGTTITLALVRGDSVVVAHVGDSRAYLIDGQDGVITQITSDHSFVEALVTAGHITREEAETHPMKNVLYRALGQAEDLDVDVYYARVQHDDRLVLCSDGLTLHVKPDEIAEHALAEGDPEAASQRLIDLANERGGKDNVSVIVIKVVDPQFGSEFEEMQAAYGDEDYDDDDTLILANRDAVKLKLDEMQKTLDTDTTQTSIDSQGEGQDTLKPDQ